MLNLWQPSIRLPGAAVEDATTACAAFREIVAFLSYFKDLKDPRQQGKVSATSPGSSHFSELRLPWLQRDALSFEHRPERGQGCERISRLHRGVPSARDLTPACAAAAYSR